MERAIRVYACVLVKWVMTIATIILVVAFIGGAALGHPDVFGTPDPSWQRTASGSSGTGDQVTINGMPGTGGATHPQLLRGYVYVASALLLLFASRLMWSFWISSSRSAPRMRATIRGEQSERSRYQGGASHFGGFLRGVAQYDALRLKWNHRPTRVRSAATVRTVEVVSPSVEGELVWLFNTAAFILVVVIYIVAFETLGSGRVVSTGPMDGLLPFQVLFRDLPTSDQRMFRAMQEGAGEAERLRAADGAWPTTPSLADAGVPPFARDPLDKVGLRWSERSERLVVNYLGVSPAAGSSAFLILIQEPDPATGEKAPQPGVVDEEHQLLTDGTLLHVTYWKSAEPSLRPGVIGDPAMAGWTQIRVTSPGKEMEQWRARLFRDS
jgi:hypothetical protein